MRAEAGFADHVDGIDAEATGEGANVAHPHRGVSRAAVEQQERRSAFGAGGDDERLPLIRRDANLLMVDWPVFEKREIAFADQAFSLGGFVDAIHWRCSFEKWTHVSCSLLCVQVVSEAG
jgi:hypothetical protein